MITFLTLSTVSLNTAEIEIVDFDKMVIWMRSGKQIKVLPAEADAVKLMFQAQFTDIVVPNGPLSWVVIARK